MSKPVNKAMIGAFVLGAVGLLLAGILALGSGSLFQKSNRYVMYFTGSVKGLSVGAPVQLKGVPIGTVSEIHIVYNPGEDTFLTEVIFDILQNSVKITGNDSGQENQKKQLTTETSVESMIENGLRAKLQLQSFVTGQLLVEFDFYPDTQVRLKSFDTEWQELPTLPSDLDELARTLGSLDIKDLVESVRKTIKGVERLITSPEIQATLGKVNDTFTAYQELATQLDQQVMTLSAELATTLSDVRHLIGTADDQVAPMTTEITATATDIRRTIARLDDRLQPVFENAESATVAVRDTFLQAEALLSQLTHLTQEDSALVFNIEETLSETKKAAAALTVLIDYLGRNPEALLTGRREPREER